MTAALFDLVFEGESEHGRDREEVRRSLENLFQFDPEDQSRLFSGQPIVLGESMDTATAESFKQALAGAGIVTRVIAADVSPARDARRERTQQRRVLGRRRARVRAGAIVPDRREGRDRRR